MNNEKFFYEHPVFTLDELTACLGKQKRASYNFLDGYRRRGRIVGVGHGVYGVVPPNSTAEKFAVNPYLLAGKITKDAVVSHHAALGYHGGTYSVWNRFFYTTDYPRKTLRHRGYEICGVKVSAGLHRARQENFGVERDSRLGTEIKVTTVERTLVDVLHRHDLCGGWEEVWRSLDFIQAVRVDLILKYVKLLDNHTVAAKVGYYLDANLQRLLLNQADVDKLQADRPGRPHCTDRGKPGKLVGKWNLIVPVELHDRIWEREI
jgi:predicted transcriptional regulator of viral defense system